MSNSTTPSGHIVADQDAWLAARLDHLEAEKAFTRQRDELSAQRRELPWLEITSDYEFDSVDGPKSLSDLFGDKSQLLVYHFMLGPDWVEGCPSCSFWADNYNGTQIHLAHRDTALVAISRAPLPEINAYRDRMGWDFDWVSSHGNTFNFDLGVSFTPEQVEADTLNYNYGTMKFPGEEGPGISTFIKEDGRVYLTYQTFSRGLDMLNGAYHMLDLTAKGRDEDNLDWTMQWLQRHDAYND